MNIIHVVDDRQLLQVRKKHAKFLEQVARDLKTDEESAAYCQFYRILLYEFDVCLTCIIDINDININ